LDKALIMCNCACSALFTF